MRTLVKFAKCESGATAIEYGLIAGLIGVTIVTVLGVLADEIDATFNDAADGLKKRPAG